MNKKIAIILVNYKDYAEYFLAECRDSIRAQNYNKDLFRVYIVDNASSEKSQEYLKNNYKEAIIIPRDDGNYAAANNLGIKKAKKDGFDYFIIANMDTIFADNWLKELVLALESESNIGLAQSKILLYRGRKSEEKEKIINSLGNIVHFLGFGFTHGYNEKDKIIIGWSKIKGYASGCSFIIKKEVVDKINGYNEELYMYHDDMDISLKARLAGYKIALASKSIVYHKYSFSRSVRMIYYMERNRYIIMFSFYKIPTIILLMPAIFFMDLGMLFYSIFNGWFKSKLRVYLYFLKPKSWVKILKYRKKIKKMRIISDFRLMKDFSGKIIFQEIDNPILRYVGNPVFSFYWKLARFLIKWLRF